MPKLPGPRYLSRFNLPDDARQKTQLFGWFEGSSLQVGQVPDTTIKVRYPNHLIRLLTKLLVLAALVTATHSYAQQRPPAQSSAPVSIQSTAQLCDASEEADVRPIWQGKDGWLFSRPDLITDLRLSETAFPYLGQLAATLKAQGVTPVMLVVPTRGVVAYGRMGSNPALADYDAEAAARGYRTFLAQLRTAGFIAPDLLDVARREGDTFFFRRDHHWTPAAAQAVAQRVAAQLETRLAALPKTPFISSQKPSERQLGTLQRRAEAFCPGFSLPLESVAQFETRLRRSETPSNAALFDAAAPKVAVVGTSNSRRDDGKPELNFAGFLRQATSLEVLDVAFPGAGVYGSLEAYLLSSEYQQTPPEVLVWETTYMSWHSRDSLEAEQRQALASAYGACSRLLAKRTLTALPSGRNVLFSNLDKNLGSAYLQLRVSDPALVRFVLELRYQTYTKHVQIDRTTRVPNTGTFFFDLRDPLDTPLEAVVLVSPKPTSGGTQVGLCPVPGPSATVR